jgi:alkylation response protein AidB-like acyl-CoA dehydrogenase
MMDSESAFDRQLWRAMADLGWLGISIPENYGGVGLSLAELVPVVEQMGRRLVPSPLVSTTLAAQALIFGGTEAQCDEWLPRIVGGEILTTALAEANGDWDLGHIDAAATRCANGLMLSGKKQFALWADCAEAIIISVRIDGAPAMALLQKADIPEGALRREIIVDETKRSFSLSLDGILLPEAAVLSGAQPTALLRHIELSAALLQSAEMCGGTQGVIDYTLDYLRTRKQFDKVIGEYQALKHPMVDAYIGYEKARSLLYSAAHSFHEQGRGEVAVRMAKASADKAYGFAADRAIQFHGGFGFTRDCDAGLHRRAAIFHASQFGDAAWHRAKLADLLLA